MKRFWLFLILPLLFSQTLLAEETTKEAPKTAKTAPQEAVRTGPKIERQDALTAEVGQILRCPVCQGMPIAESPSQMAQDMMVLVREMVQEGKNKEEIISYFEERYGEWVLLAPKAYGINLGLWIFPLLFIVLGGLLVWTYKGREKAPLSDGPDTESKDTPEADAKDINKAEEAPPPTSEDEDEYLAALRLEVDE